MRFRMGVIVGFGTGYYLGAMAGRERYEQLNRMLRKVKRSDAFDAAADKAKAVVDLGKEFGVTRERIRQIESKTLAKLRHPIRSQRLRDYLDEE